MKRPLAVVCIIVALILAVSAKYSDDYEIKYGFLNEKEITLEGTVEDIVIKRNYNYEQIIIYLKEGVICYMKEIEQYPNIGSKITIKGKAYTFKNATNEGQFDQRNYYEIIGVKYGLKNAKIISCKKEYSRIKHTLFKIRRSFSMKLEQALPSKEASILKTMLLGEKSELDNELKELYQRNGIAHILAISGLHISMIGGIFYKLLLKLNVSMKKASILSFLFVLLYGGLTGFSVSAIRAVLMFGIRMLSFLLGRAYDFMTSVSLAMVSILLLNPLYIYHSGFVFSFGCVFGIGVLVPTLTSDNMSEKGHFIKNMALSSLTILVSGVPIYYWYYYQIPVYSIFLNILVIPVMSILVPAGLLLICSMYIHPSIGYIFKILIVGILKLFQVMAEFTDGLNGHFYTPGRPKLIQIIIFIVILFLIVMLKKYLSLRMRWIITMMAILMLTLRVKDPFKITFLDVGQGDGICLSVSKTNIIIPGISSEFNMLIDGGSSSESKVGKYRIIPYLKYNGISKLDAVVFTHPDDDHINGLLELLDMAHNEGIWIKRVILAESKGLKNDEGYLKIIDKCREDKVDIKYIKTMDEIKFNKLNIKCLTPDSDFVSSDSNENSITLYVNYDDVSAVLTGDIEGIGEMRMLENIKKEGINNIDILKVAHHGSKNSSNSELLRMLNPKLSIISVGKDNSYGHPHKETLDRLSKFTKNAKVFRTDESGQVSIIVGENVKVRQFKERNNDDK